MFLGIFVHIRASASSSSSSAALSQVRDTQPDEVVQKYLPRELYKKFPQDIWNIILGEYHTLTLDELALVNNTFYKKKEHGTLLADGTLATDFNLACTLNHHGEQRINSVHFSADGQCVVTSTASGRLYIWRVADGSLVKTIADNASWVTTAQFSPDGRYIAAASVENNQVRIWRVVDSELVQVLSGHRSGVHSVRFSPHGKWLATAAWDRQTCIWRLVGGMFTLQHTFKDQYIATDMSWNVDNERLVTVSRDTRARIWDTVQGRLLSSTNHPHIVRAACFSPDGEQVMTASGRTVYLWDADAHRGSLVKKFSIGKRKAIACGAKYSPDGHYVGAIFENGAEWIWRMWRVSDGALMSAFKHERTMHDIQWSPRNHCISTVSDDDNVRLYERKSLKKFNNVEVIRMLAQAKEIKKNKTSGCCVVS